MSHDASEIILICWFAAQEAFLIISVENSTIFLWKPWYLSQTFITNFYNHLCILILTFLSLVLVSKVGSDAIPFAILSPPFRLNTDLNGLTILVCVVHDIHQGELEVAWISSGTRGAHPAVSNLLQGHGGIQSSMSVISVPSSEWMSYTCFVSHRGSDQLLHRHYAGLPMETTGKLCNHCDIIFVNISHIYVNIC